MLLQSHQAKKKINIAVWYSCIIYQYCFTPLLLASVSLLKYFFLFDWFYYAQFFSYRRIFLLYSTCTHLRLFSEVSLHHTFYLAYTASNLIPWFLCLPYVPFLSLCGNVLRLHYTPTASLLLEGNQSLSKGCWEMLPIINTSHQQALYKYLLSRCLFRVTHTLRGMSVIFISWC